MAVVAGGMIASSVIGGIAADKASKRSAAGYDRAAGVVGGAGKEARGLQEQYSAGTRQDFQPYLQAGQTGINTYMQEASQGFNLPEFQQPTEADMLVDPSYQWRLDQGMEATTRALTKSGQAWGGQRGIALMDYAQNAASQEYANIYDRSLKNYQMRYNRQGDYLNRLGGIADMGLSATTSLGGIDANYAGNIASTITGTASRVGQQYTGSANARASGILGVGRAFQGAAEGISMLGMGSGGTAMQGAYSGGAGGIL